MIDHTAIAQGADLRALIADLTKPYEAKHGPIKTDAIEPRIEQKRPGFNRGSNASPGQETQPKPTRIAKPAAVASEVWLQ